MDENIVFSLKHPEDLLKCAVFSLSKIKNTERTFETDYYLLNAIFALNHLLDWAIKSDMSADDKQKCMEQFNPYPQGKEKRHVSADFQDFYRENFPENKYQSTIRKLCNQSKHIKSKGSESERIERKTKTAGMVCGAPDACCGNKNAVCGNPKVRYVVEINNEDIQLEDILEGLIQDWTKFFEEKKVTQSD